MSIKSYLNISLAILLYNCENALAYMPKTWDYKKFTEKLWDIGDEINKVITSFIRQILGVHKKSSTLAILAETGKYPISIKIMTQIIKYWIRLDTSEDNLLTATRLAIEDHNQKGNQNWKKIVHFILKYCNIHEEPSKITPINKNLTNTFQNNIKNLYVEWWRSKIKPENSTKYDFFYKYKKHYIFEKYLDKIPRDIRLYVTRLCTSSHNLPVEILLCDIPRQ